MICKKCMRALQRTIQPALAFADRSSKALNPPRDAKAYREDRCDLLHWIANGCWICRKLIERLVSNASTTLSEERATSFLIEYSCYGAIYESTRDFVIAKIEATIVDEETEAFEATMVDDETVAGCEIEIQLISSNGYSISGDLRDSTNSRDAFDTILKWLTECRCDHTACRQNDISFTPSRLIYIGETNTDAKLIMTSTQHLRHPYLTLSHRWGSENYTKLESSTMTQLQQGIDISKLPSTFQDAIDITRRLNFQYLWIDSLCIVQDEHDKSDWLSESAKMGDIYSNAMLNLSATGVSNSSSSLFFDRDLNDLLPSPVELEVANTVRQYHLVDGEMWEDDVTLAPLNLRAWVFQERMLAPRVLHFGKRQLAWECRQLDAVELFPDGLPQRTYSTLPKQEIGAALTMSSLEIPSEKTRNAFLLWRNMVEFYSKCSITRLEDKLIALSGLAKSIQRVTCDEYMAGMWRRTMAYDLPWWRETKYRESLPSNSSPYRAPSWSWASVDGEIIFPGMSGGVYEHFITVLETDLVYVSEEDPTGGLTAGSIQIVCLLNTLTIHGLLDDETFSGLTISGSDFKFSRDASTFLSPELSYQELVNHNSRDELYCVACCATNSELCGILLVNLKHDQLYHRVGSLALQISDEFEEIVEEDAENEEDEEEILKQNKREALCQNIEIGSEDNLWGTALDDMTNTSQHTKTAISTTHRKIADALKTASQRGYSLPCDFYEKDNGTYMITII